MQYSVRASNVTIPYTGAGLAEVALDSETCKLIAAYRGRTTKAHSMESYWQLAALIDWLRPVLTRPLAHYASRRGAPSSSHRGPSPWIVFPLTATKPVIFRAERACVIACTQPS